LADLDTSTYDILGISSENIRICKNDNRSPSETPSTDSHCQNNGIDVFAQNEDGSNANSGDYFELDNTNNRIKLKESINMKSWGGPRHELLLITTKGSDCTVRLGSHRSCPKFHKFHVGNK